MKRTLISLLLVTIFFTNSINADSLSSPKDIVKNFFSLLEKNNVEQIKTSIPKDRYLMHNKLKDWDRWIGIWRSYELVKIGKVQERKYVRKDREKSVKVHVVLKIDGKEMPGTIQVSRINNKWVWDEN